ncbi:MAG: alpha/beta fold hydrolase [Deltaproteobacteria bacterium]|nr:alpha/beta fold hydrolase [Deltaproteobacteria bacterium]
MTALHFSLLHGFLQNQTSWNSLTEKLRVAFPGATFTPHNLPGHGETAVSSPTALSSTSHLSDAIQWYIAQIQPISPCWAIGYSMGARLVLNTMLSCPDLFLGTVLISVHPGIRTAAERRARIEWEQRLISIARNGGMSDLVEYFEGLPIFESQSKLATSKLQHQQHMRLSHHPEDIANAISLLGLGHSPDTDAALSQCNRPTLLITGERDTKYSQLSAEMSRRSKRIQHHTISGVGHNTVLEAPHQTFAAIAAFITRYRTAQSTGSD